MEKELLKSINKRLEVIIVLLLHLRLQKPERPRLREQIKVLDDLGVEPKDIANILGRSNNFIYKELSELRKPRKAKK
ncbi:hypothetical protein COX73_00070 [bacterium (Candidatus Gribaldobacteria) CG_4_10_14_0_2_um_filter_36_18]|uniref:Uncharacterized protein n=1 Tax=bacterium (Candidatus Gribaldobacteria) CG_4_10_14_0_2_um_filter_36_18 TaxID=2014264 RepID=A0A2M7VLE2_9BACT|nr:MAG: hypothetical protein COX73_00070 [bacterium (Candidatus Gribaldobacteria) CG_4_10_14_0_2_um_filter_36_18]